MAFSTGKKKQAMSDINVTPLVDVMLVLLVIFMVTTPMMISGIDLKLPKTKKVSTLSMKPELTILSYAANEDFFIGKEKVLKEALIDRLLKEFEKNKTDVVYLRADYELKYEKVAKLMSELKQAGISNIALVTEIERAK